MMLDQINALLEDIGECAIIEPWVVENRWHAAIYLRTDFNDLALVAGWFHDLGATEVVVEHTLYCDFNGNRGGQIPNTGSKAWGVFFTFDGDMESNSTPPPH